MEQVWSMEHTHNNGPKKTTVALKKLACGMISETFVQMSFIHYLSLVNLVLRYGLDSIHGERGGGPPIGRPPSPHKCA
jgi:hypothetical protein